MENAVIRSAQNKTRSQKSPACIALFSARLPRACIILSDEDNPGERRAATELAKYLLQITGVRFPCCVGEPCDNLLPIAVGASRQSSRIMRHASLSLSDCNEDGFGIAICREGIALLGRRGRSTLYAVYAFLEMLGCRFLEPGAAGEVIPCKTSIEVAQGTRKEHPAFSYRDVNLDLTRFAGIEHEVDIIDWTLKNRGNMIELVPFHTNYSRIIEHFDILLAEIKKRDMIAVFGGHGVGMFFILPEDCLFPGKKPRDFDHFVRLINRAKKKEPGLFGEALKPVKGTNNEPLFCMASEKARKRFVANVATFLKNYPQIDIIRFGQNDCCLPCPCAACASGRIEQYFGALLPQLGAVLKKHFPAKRFLHMLQGKGGNDFSSDEIPAVRKMAGRIPKNIMFCIGNENFDFRGDISQCFNRYNFRRIHDFRAALRSHQFITKEMYGSGLYNRIPGWAVDVICRNMQYYKNKLPNYIGSWVFINPSNTWRVWSPNLYAFLRLLWDPDVDAKYIVNDYIGHAYGHAQRTGRAVCDVFTRHGIRVGVLNNIIRYGTLDEAQKALLNAGRLLEMSAKKGRKLIADIRHKLKVRSNAFLAEWLAKDLDCLLYFVDACETLLTKMRSMKMTTSTPEVWPKDWRARLMWRMPYMS